MNSYDSNYLLLQQQPTVNKPPPLKLWFEGQMTTSVLSHGNSSNAKKLIHTNNFAARNCYAPHYINRS